MGQTAATVLKLMKPYLNKGYHVFTDNYYSFVSLTDFLSTQATYITGALRKDRKWNPELVKKPKLKKGELIWRSQNDVTVCNWKDKRDLLPTSNAHVPQMVKVTNQTKYCPRLQ